MDAVRLHALLRRDPLRFALPLGWLEASGVVPAVEGGRFCFVGVGGNDAMAGAALVVGRALAFVAADEPTDAVAIGEFLLRSAACPRTVTGPREAVGVLAQLLQRERIRVGQHVQQTVMSLHSRDLRYFAEPDLTAATDADLADVLAESVAMHLEETGFAASRADIESIDAATRSRVRSGRLWIVRDAMTGELLFKASVAAVAAGVSQIEGVWVPPVHRGRGIGRRAISELCRRLLTDVGALTLYVSDSNEPALRLYRRVGFRDHGAWATLHLATR